MIVLVIEDRTIQSFYLLKVGLEFRKIQYSFNYWLIFWYSTPT
jgi:hypothetical protein